MLQVAWWQLGEPLFAIDWSFYSKLSFLIHPALAVVWVFPVIGVVSYYAWLVRQRRLATQSGSKSKIPPVVGKEHVALGKWLAGSVVGLALLGLGHPLLTHAKSANYLQEKPFLLVFQILMFVATAVTFVLLLRARPLVWRAIFATLSGAGIVILGAQDGIFRRTNEWFISHYYYGIAASLLMIFSVAIVGDIYRSKRWRLVHIILNTFALFLFIGQGLTGVRDVTEIAIFKIHPLIFN
ncbi:MAG: DUF4079 domain-containing protein [Cyanobacteria bacterium P01_H01_bin.15]